MRKIFFKSLLSIFISLLLFSPVLAEKNELCPDGSVRDPSIGCIITPGGIVDSNTNIMAVFIKTADFFAKIAALIAVIIILISGIQYALAMGDDEKINIAKRNFKWSIIGLIIAITAYGIVEFVIKNVAE